MITLHLPSCLSTSPDEADLVGYLVVHYGELEWMLCRVVAALTEDLDAVVKSMYRKRGEQARLNIAKRLASPHLLNNNLVRIFNITFDAVDACRIIRNDYAHAHWLPGSERQFGFYALEKLARRDEPLNLSSMERSVIDKSTLQKQTIYFAEVLHNLVHMFYVLEARQNERVFEPKFIDPIRPPPLAWSQST